MIGIVIERRASHCSQQHRGRRQACSNRVGRERIVDRGQGRASDMFALRAKFVTEGIRNCLEYPDCLLGNFGADAVAGKDGEVQEHAELV